jgi:hypothetical protein
MSFIVHCQMILTTHKTWCVGKKGGLCHVKKMYMCFEGLVELVNYNIIEVSTVCYKYLKDKKEMFEIGDQFVILEVGFEGNLPGGDSGQQAA